MASGDGLFSWLNQLDTPIGPVVCGLYSPVPLQIESDARARIGSHALEVERFYFDLPNDWNGGRARAIHVIDGGRCWRWWFTCREDISPPLELRCTLVNPGSAIWDTATGEDLAAIRYDSDGTTLHIGTEDEHRNLDARAQLPDGLFPKRLLLSSDFFFTLDRSGVRIHIPALQKGERVYFHLIAAFKMDDNDGATWSAVNRYMPEIDKWIARPL